MWADDINNIKNFNHLNIQFFCTPFAVSLSLVPSGVPLPIYNCPIILRCKIAISNVMLL